MKVLIADDDPTMRKLLKHNLSQWDYEVVECENGSDAWEIIQSKDSPSLLLLDWVMPDFSGVELCKKIRKLNKKPSPYIVLLTGKSDVKDIITGIESGADDYIIKTCAKNELRVRLKAGKRIVEMGSEIDIKNEIIDSANTGTSDSNNEGNFGLKEQLFYCLLMLFSGIIIGFFLRPIL